VKQPELELSFAVVRSIREGRDSRNSAQSGGKSLPYGNVLIELPAGHTSLWSTTCSETCTDAVTVNNRT
jgi:hypothetical protein